MNSSSTLDGRVGGQVGTSGGAGRRGLHLVLALVVGALVSVPALPDATASSVGVVGLVAGVAVAVLLQRRPGGGGSVGRATRGLLVGAGIVGALLLLSIGFGIAAAEAPLLVAVPALVAIAMTYAIARAVDA
ncbi:hypothetical protein INN71_11985 [Nocardioides sp. ChNu-153]|uniref:hypothetical protein n=1 Tax=Nocardioides sp. ChNu-153 TaxID=2779364 RepID=UPI00264E3B12|nr:hypothetical protein [Nocardioides sp. ChNu-153]MDN7122109.1 hypothetical protein [Nocardioides sp. ChNu-153]